MSKDRKELKKRLHRVVDEILDDFEKYENILKDEIEALLTSFEKIEQKTNEGSKRKNRFSIIDLFNRAFSKGK